MFLRLGAHRVLFFVALFTLAGQPIIASEQGQDIVFDGKPTNLYAAIAKENLKALTDLSLDDVTKNGVCSVLNNVQDQGFNAVIKAKFESQLHPNPDARRRLMYTLLSQYEETHALPKSDVLDQKTWQDLEILCGPKSNARLYLAAQLDRTVTEAGRVAFYRKMVSPIADTKQLQNQQAIVVHLVNNEPFFNELDEKLKALVESENLMLSFWDAEDLFSFCHEQNKIKVPFDSNFTCLKNLKHSLNNSPALLEARTYMRRFFGSMADLFLVYGCLAIPVYALTGTEVASFLPENVYESNWIPKARDLTHVSMFSMMGIASWLISKACANDPERVYFERLSQGGLAAWSNADQIYWTIKDFFEQDEFGKSYYAKVVSVACYMNSLRAMSELVAKNEALAARLPALKEFNNYLAKLGQTSKDMNDLLELLETKTFDGDYSSWFMYKGRLRVAFQLITEVKGQFVEAMLALGELDAQLSIAKLYKEFKDKRVSFCFPTLIDTQLVGAPSVKAIDFWNPFLDPEKVVPSSLVIGKSYEKPQNIIITGPNAGGKSTITKAFVMAVILAQSLGIAPAKELTLTPFKKIITYLNITDDIAAGNSHFKAGVLRAQDVEKTYQECKNHEFVLAAIDEVFNGTTFKEGQAAAYSLIWSLGSHPLGMCVTNTHFPIIPTLEKTTDRFMNYKVTVIEKPGEKIQYPFKLEPGISDQIVTLKILKEEGFDDQFLDRAQHVLDRGIAVSIE